MVSQLELTAVGTDPVKGPVSLTATTTSPKPDTLHVFTDLRFAGEPYVVRTRPRSVLCLALQHQGRTTAILYLENNAVTEAFTALPSPSQEDLLAFLRSL